MIVYVQIYDDDGPVNGPIEIDEDDVEQFQAELPMGQYIEVIK